jgi:membrane-associated phospholipid phosphatase
MSEETVIEHFFGRSFPFAKIGKVTCLQNVLLHERIAMEITENRRDDDVRNLKTHTSFLGNVSRFCRLDVTNTYLIVAFILLLSSCVTFHWDKELSDMLRFDPVLHGNRSIADLVGMVRVFGKGDVLLFLALALGLKGIRQGSTAILIALILATLLVWPLKLTVKRERPRGHSFVSFPSGDTAAAAAFSVPSVMELPALLPVAGAVVAGVSFGRVFDGAHYPSDVMAGAAIGILAGWMGWLLCRRFEHKFRRSHFVFLMSVFLSGWLVFHAWGGSSEALPEFITLFGPSLTLAAMIY